MKERGLEENGIIMSLMYSYASNPLPLSEKNNSTLTTKKRKRSGLIRQVNIPFLPPVGLGLTTVPFHPKVAFINIERQTGESLCNERLIF